MSEETKPAQEELKKRIEDLEKAAKKYRTKLEETIKSRPLTSVGIAFVGAIVLGVLIGKAGSRRT